MLRIGLKMACCAFLSSLQSLKRLGAVERLALRTGSTPWQEELLLTLYLKYARANGDEGETRKEGLGAVLYHAGSRENGVLDPCDIDETL